MSPTSPSSPARLGVLLSGSGRTLENLLSCMSRGELPAQVAVVIASKPCRGAEIARAAGLPTLEMPGRIPAAELRRVLGAHGAAWVVLAGYLKLLDVPREFRGRVVNIHPALLPEFGGPGMYGERVHEAVLRTGRRESGCTVHLVDEQYDHGPILLQRRCPVLSGDTAATLGARVFAEECLAYPEAIRRLLAGEYRSQQERAGLDEAR